MTTYKKPPLYEVSFGLQFKALSRMKVPHFGIFWEKIKQEFPNIEQVAPIMKNEIGFDEPYLVPRVWFIDNTDTRLVQLQTDRIHFNWRQRPGMEEYPRFINLFPIFKQMVSDLEETIASESIGVIEPTSTEITYFNLFKQGEEWSTPEGIKNIFKDIFWNKSESRFLPSPKQYRWEMVFPIPDQNGILHAKLSQVTTNVDQKKALLLELVASRLVENVTVQSLIPWYNIGHEWIVNGFNDLTQPEAQRNHWGREE